MVGRGPTTGRRGERGDAGADRVTTRPPQSATFAISATSTAASEVAAGVVVIPCNRIVTGATGRVSRGIDSDISLQPHSWTAGRPMAHYWHSVEVSAN